MYKIIKKKRKNQAWRNCSLPCNKIAYCLITVHAHIRPRRSTFRDAISRTYSQKHPIHPKSTEWLNYGIIYRQYKYYKRLSVVSHTSLNGHQYQNILLWVIIIYHSEQRKSLIKNTCNIFEFHVYVCFV